MAVGFWRLTLLWRGSVVDLFSMRPEAVRQYQMRDGTQLTLRAISADMVPVSDEKDAHTSDTAERAPQSYLDFGAIEVVIDGAKTVYIHDGKSLDLPAHHILCVNADDGRHQKYDGWEAAGQVFRRKRLDFDSYWLHALLLAVTLQVLFVGAIFTTQTHRRSQEPGAGLWSSTPSLAISLPSGSAMTSGAAMYAPAGRHPEDGERVLHMAPESGHGTQPTSSAPTLGERVTSIFFAATPTGATFGNPHEAAPVLGNGAINHPASPTQNHGVGGLGGKNAPDRHEGSGAVGVGEQVHIKKEDKPVSVAENAIAVSVQEVPNADIDVEENNLNPLIRDHLTRMVRERRNAVRYCYETWGLTANASLSGRLMLELTLGTDGMVSDPVASVSEGALIRVGRCVEQMASSWYLGAGLVDKPVRLSFPFRLTPRGN